MSTRRWLGKVGYGATFVVALPALLVVWARQTEGLVTLPVPPLPGLGWAAVVAGAWFMAWAMADLWFRGRGLPMNAYPPTRLVTSGAYWLFAHPIYVGASLAGAGLAVGLGSASGFWLGVPTLTLGWLALVWGYENEALRQRFPDLPTARPLLSLPSDGPGPPSRRDRWSAGLLAFLPWLGLYELLIFAGPPARPISTFLPFETSLPVWPWTTFFYTLCYPFVTAVVFLVNDKPTLRRFVVEAALLTGVGIFVQAGLPLVAEPRPLVPEGFWGHWLAWERGLDGPAAAFPSFHVAWALLAARYYLGRRPVARWLVRGLAWAIVASCATTGMHSLLDILAGVGLYWLVTNHRSVWEWVRARLERLANSWRAWQWGPLRIINHSLYAGVGAGVGALLACALVGDWVVVVAVGLAGIVGAGAWAQLVEGSSGLSRPFGYYGCVLFGTLACLVVPLFRGPGALAVLASFALASPWVQALGRLRCVVQGCCHGRPAPASIGIRVSHPKSRVCSLSHLQGRPIHPTPLYSIVANVALGTLLWRGWYGQVAPQLLVGCYFMGSGLARFVEEAYRGEVQTPTWHQLRLYQWLALASVLLGVAITMWPAAPVPLDWHWQPSCWPVALGFGLVAAFAMGMDFPQSTRRFSRLAG